MSPPALHRPGPGSPISFPSRAQPSPPLPPALLCRPRGPVAAHSPRGEHRQGAQTTEKLAGDREGEHSGREGSHSWPNPKVNYI